MNPQNARTMAAMTSMALTSPFPMRQLFSAGAPSVKPRTNPTEEAATQHQRVSTEHNDDGTTIIKLATYNIRDSRNSNLEAVLRACEQMRIDVGILTETRLSTDRYTRSAYGYTVFATQTNHTNQGGIALIFTNSLYFQIESQQKHGPNVISFILLPGKRRYPMIGAYIPPHDTTTLHYISKASDRFAGEPIILLGDINVDPQTQTPNHRDTEIMALSSTLGLEDMATHFIQRKKF
jgi:exonuclease III